ncbi:MAG: prepilin-type N-terminal cleavage/methylation domain-containing protein [Pyrinomonadaceae bacterium]
MRTSNFGTDAASIARTRRSAIAGFSVIEILVVLVVIAILSAISIPYVYNYTKLYKSEDQAIKVMDLMRETAQLALTRRRTMRFEIDLTDNAALVIDENGAAPDTLIKRIPLESVSEVRMDAVPSGVTRPTPPNYADAAYTTDTLGHQRAGQTVINNMVWAARFRSDGTAVNAANLPMSVTLYSWPPAQPGSMTPRKLGEVRAITLFGGTGAVRYWKHSGTAFVPYQ